MAPDIVSKRPFQLLELMIALFILLLCAPPAFHLFTQIFKYQQDIVRENQRDHIARLIHAKIVEQLYRNEVQLQTGEKEILVTWRDADIEALLNRYRYSAKGSLTVLESSKRREEESANKYLVQLLVKIKDERQEKKSKREKDSTSPAEESVYDFLIYIDSGSRDKEADTDTPGDSQEKKGSLKTPVLESKKQTTAAVRDKKP